MSYTTSELVWIVGVMKDLYIHVSYPVTLLCDNKATQYIAANPVFYNRTKHLDLDCHYIRDNVQDGFLQTSHVKSQLQLADLMTKTLPASQHHYLSVKLGLVHSSQVPLEGGCRDYCLFILLLVQLSIGS